PVRGERFTLGIFRPSRVSSVFTLTNHGLQPWLDSFAAVRLGITTWRVGYSPEYLPAHSPEWRLECRFDTTSVLRAIATADQSSEPDPYTPSSRPAISSVLQVPVGVVPALRQLAGPAEPEGQFDS